MSDFVLDARLKRDKFLELLSQVLKVQLDVVLSSGHSCYHLFDMGQVFVELVASFSDLEEPLVVLVSLGKGVEEAVGEVVEHAAASGIAARGSPDAAAAHRGIPVRALKENVEDIGSTKDRMEGKAVKEALERMRSTVGEVRAEAIATNIFHSLLVREGGDCGGRVVSAQRLIQEDKVCKPPADCCLRSLEGGKCRLKESCQRRANIQTE